MSESVRSLLGAEAEIVGRIQCCHVLAQKDVTPCRADNLSAISNRVVTSNENSSNSTRYRDTAQKQLRQNWPMTLPVEYAQGWIPRRIHKPPRLRGHIPMWKLTLS